MRTQADNTLTPILPLRGLAPDPRVLVDIVLPVHNVEPALPAALRRLHAGLATTLDVPFRVTIADGGSSDNTATVARFLARELARVRYVHVAQPGRGRALRAAWASSDAEVLACMDLFAAADPAQLRALLEPLLANRADLVVGSRLAPGPTTTRDFGRDAISRTYNALLAGALSAAFSDPRCALKAGRREVICELLPLVEDEGAFFDTELLYLAQRNAFSIREVPVGSIGDPHTCPGITQTALEDLHGIARLRRRTRERRDLIVRSDGGAPAPDRGTPTRLRAQRVGRPGHGAARASRSGGCAATRVDAQAGAPVLP